MHTKIFNFFIKRYNLKISESNISSFSGYTLEAQKSLFDNIKPLFSNKPLMVVANKKDVWTDNLTDEKKAIMDSFEPELVTTLISFEVARSSLVGQALGW
jgi:GTP1/Obg family GTP-binding protein